jgi:hypothetical protein
MKKIYVLVMCIMGMNLVQAKPIAPASAKNVAISFYKQHSDKVPQTVTLAYTETSSAGEALYYVFNINSNDGFVIITADDAAHPIIGYSTERQFVIPEQNTSFNYWMDNRKKEIVSIKAANIKATAAITREWQGDFSATNNLSQRTNGLNSVSTASVAPLTQTTWDQPSPYNAKCPGTGSKQGITGCVATTMSQIMKFWAYPAKGIGSSSYTQNPNPNSYPAQSVNYAATTYSWSSMPASVTSSNAAVATLMYQCGVSVDMNYSATESSAYVLSVDVGGAGAPCAQNSYITYFGYDPSKIQGYQRTQGKYTDAAWLNLIETDLSAGRPVEYAGVDPKQGGHTWVCDGFDVNNNLHMNWGWSGSSNGYYSINALTTQNAGFDPSTNHEILVGIQPPPTLDAGITAISKPIGVLCNASFSPVVTLKNFGINTLTTCSINYQLDGGTVQTYSWTGSLTTQMTATVSLPSMTVALGTHTFTCMSASPNKSTDANSANDQSNNVFVYSTVGATLPLVEGFEASSNLPAGWSVGNPNNDLVTWQVVPNVAHTGSNSIGFNNCNGDGAGDMTGHKDWLYTTTYDFSSVSTASLSFDVGYVPAADTSGGKTNLYTDSLAVYYSINCGSTWTKLFQKGGTALATAPQFTVTATVNCNAPTSSQWVTSMVNLSALLGQSSVELGFENISDYGNWIYMDNINITATSSATGIASHSSVDGINVYPNPAHTNLFVSLTENTSSVSVTDVIGQTVVAEQRVNGLQEQVHAIDISNLAAGIYFVRVNSNSGNPKIIRFIKD